MTLFDQNYADLAPLWVERMHHLGLFNLLMVALDPPSLVLAQQHKLPAMSLECVLNDCKSFATKVQSVRLGARMVTFAVPDDVHVKLSPLRAIVEAGVHVLFSEMDVLILRNPLSGVAFANFHSDLCAFYGRQEDMRGDQMEAIHGLGPAMIVSAHNNHPRVNIGLFFLRADDTAVHFCRQLENNWKWSQKTQKRGGVWDQVLWDALLNNSDKLSAGHSRASIPIRWSKLDPCIFTEDGRSLLGNHANCHTWRPHRVYTWHLTYLDIRQKLSIMRTCLSSRCNSTLKGRGSVPLIHGTPRSRAASMELKVAQLCDEADCRQIAGAGPQIE